MGDYIWRRNEQKDAARRRRPDILLSGLVYSQDPLESIVILPAAILAGIRHDNTQSRQSSSFFFFPFFRLFHSTRHCTDIVLYLYYITYACTSPLPITRYTIRLCVYTVCNILFHCSGSSQQVEHIHLLPLRKKFLEGFYNLHKPSKNELGRKKKDAHHVGWSIGFAAEAICNSCVSVFAHVDLYTVYTCLGAFWTSSATQI